MWECRYCEALASSNTYKGEIKLIYEMKLVKINVWGHSCKSYFHTYVSIPWTTPLTIFKFIQFMRKMKAPGVQPCQLTWRWKIELSRILKIQSKNGKLSQLFILFKGWRFLYTHSNEWYTYFSGLFLLSHSSLCDNTRANPQTIPSKSSHIILNIIS